MKTIADQVRNLAPVERRRFLKLLSAVVGAPLVPPAVKYAAQELAVDAAYAQQQLAAEGILFLEFNYRDQVDLMHVMVPPSIATYPNRMVGVDKDQLSMFESQANIQQFDNNVYLTSDSLELAPHLDDIAMIDTGEAAIGAIHGHEAGNGMRSPGREMNNPAAGMPMFRPDEASKGGSEELYGRVPTPAVMHNYYLKQMDPSLKNGWAFKGISRYKHSVYHFGAGLPGADIDRYQSKSLLFEAFPEVVTDINVLQSAEQAELLVGILNKLDSRFIGKRGYAQDVGLRHTAELEGSKLGFFNPEPIVVKLPLEQEEMNYWGNGVPGQKCTRGDTEVVDCNKVEMEGENPPGDGFIKAEVWEQFAYAQKLLTAGVTKSIALEFDFMDLHGDGVRTEAVLRDQAKQVSMPLARIINKLKEAGVWHRSLIAVYTLDGSRTPQANSYGNNGKGTMILAGGMIKGGYYGDIQITADTDQGHEYALVPPDPTSLDGRHLAPVGDWNDKAARTSSAAAWRTVMKAAGVPDSVINEQDFTPEVTNAKPLNFMFKNG